MSPREFRTYVNELVSPYSNIPSPSDATIDALAYKAMSMMFRMAKPAEARINTNISIVAAQAKYALPSDVLVVMSVKALDSSGSNYQAITKLTQEALDTVDVDWENAGTSNVSYYYEAGIVVSESDSDYGKRQIGLEPTPGSAVTSGLKVRYIKKPKKLSAFTTDTKEIVEVPEDFHEVIANYVAVKLLARNSGAAKGDVQLYAETWKSGLAEYVDLHSEWRMEDYDPSVPAPRFNDFWDSF